MRPILPPGADLPRLRSTPYVKPLHDQADRVVIANTKGFTGHAMGVGIEDVMAVKALQYGKVPPIAHINDGFEPDPELGDLEFFPWWNLPDRVRSEVGSRFWFPDCDDHVSQGKGNRRTDELHTLPKLAQSVSGYSGSRLRDSQRTLRSVNQELLTRAAGTELAGHSGILPKPVDGRTRSW